MRSFDERIVGSYKKCQEGKLWWAQDHSKTLPTSKNRLHHRICFEPINEYITKNGGCLAGIRIPKARSKVWSFTY